MKNPLRPAGIEPATFRFVAQHLNHCATAVPRRLMDWQKFHNVLDKRSSALSIWYRFAAQHDNGAANMMIIRHNVISVHLHEENNRDRSNKRVKTMGLQAGVWVGHWLSFLPFVTAHVARYSDSLFLKQQERNYLIVHTAKNCSPFFLHNLNTASFLPHPKTSGHCLLIIWVKTVPSLQIYETQNKHRF